jgi:hypothetical protein
MTDESMMHTRHRYYLIFWLTLGGGGMAATAEGSGAIAARLSTLGVGAEVIAPLSDRVNLRLALNHGGIEYKDTHDDIDYQVDARLRSGGAMLDWHPTGGRFRFSVGAFYNGNELDGEARPREPTTIGLFEFTPEQIGTLSADVKFAKLAGYAGIGFGNAARTDRGWTVLFDLGVLFYSSPDFTLTADGTLAGHPFFEANLQRERDSIEDDYVRAARVYPVVSIGLGFRF